MKVPVIAVVGVLMTVSCCPAAACDDPHGQSLRQFYNPDKFGQLGVKGLGLNVHLLDAYKCYDFSFLIHKNLQIYFNNASTGSSRPTYVGALIFRLFSSKNLDEAPFQGYLYRNDSDQASGSDWAQIKKSPNVDVVPEVGTSYAEKDLSIVDKYFGENNPLPAKSFEDLNEMNRNEKSDAAKQISDWHALVIAKDGDVYRVYENTARDRKKWFMIDVRPPAASQYGILKSYLVKYQSGPNPSWKPFFGSGAEAADCVYIKLVGPGDSVTSFDINRPEQSRDFFTLKMRGTASCEVP